MLLHVCCAPCSIYALCYWREQGLEPELYYFNPNIHPYLEYIQRRDALLRLAKDDAVTLHVAEAYPFQEFLRLVLSEDVERCVSCYRLRLEQTAQKALQLGHQEFSTSLLISPYQQHDRLATLGTKIAADYGLVFRYADLRPGFRVSQNTARERDYYRQKYCGCLFSEWERYSKIK